MARSHHKTRRLVAVSVAALVVALTGGSALADTAPSAQVVRTSQAFASFDSVNGDVATSFWMQGWNVDITPTPLAEVPPLGMTVTVSQSHVVVHDDGSIEYTPIWWAYCFPTGNDLYDFALPDGALTFDHHVGATLSATADCYRDDLRPDGTVVSSLMPLAIDLTWTATGPAKPFRASISHSHAPDFFYNFVFQGANSSASLEGRVRGGEIDLNGSDLDGNLLFSHQTTALK